MAAVLAGAAADARADGAVMVVGHVSPRDRDVIVDAIKSQGSALSVRFSAAASRDTDASFACLRDNAPWTCVAPAVRGKDQLVIVEVQSDRGAGAPMTIVTAHLLTAGAETESFASRNCAMCSEGALKRTVEELGRELLQRAAARSGRTRLAIRSTPDRAEILLDGAPAGATDAEIATYPGRHTVAIRARGFATATRDVITVEGRTVELVVQLGHEAPAPPGAPRAPPAPPASHLVPGIAIGVGAAAMIAGGLLIAFDQDPDPSGEQPYYYDTARAGVATLAAGAVIAGVGAYLWLRPRAASVAAVAPLPGGAAVVWAGRF